MVARFPRNHALKKSSYDPQRVTFKQLHQIRITGKIARISKRRADISRQRGRRLGSRLKRLYQRFQVITIGGRPVLRILYFLRLQSGFVQVDETMEEIFPVQNSTQSPCPDDFMMDWSPTLPPNLPIAHKGIHQEPEVDQSALESSLGHLVDEGDTFCVVVLGEKDFLAGKDALGNHTFLEEESESSESEDEDDDDDGDEDEYEPPWDLGVFASVNFFRTYPSRLTI